MTANKQMLPPPRMSWQPKQSYTDSFFEEYERQYGDEDEENKEEGETDHIA